MMTQRLLEALPQSFPFYHLGEVRLLDTGEASYGLDLAGPGWDTPSSSDSLAVGFSLEGDVSGWMILVLDEGLDLSTYSEMGNIIASRMAGDLSDRSGLDVTISPPRVLGRPQLKALISGGQAQARSYLHQRGEDSPIILQAFVVPAEGNPGHA